MKMCIEERIGRRVVETMSVGGQHCTAVNKLMILKEGHLNSQMNKYPVNLIEAS